MIQTYIFREQGGVIPGIPNPASADGEFPAGMSIDVDLETRQIVAMRVIPGAMVPFPVQEKTKEGKKKGGDD